MFSQSLSNLRISLKRNHLPARPDDPRRHHRKNPDIRADVIKGHAGPQMLSHDFQFPALTRSGDGSRQPFADSI